MVAKDLIEILRKLPEDTWICRTIGEAGFEELDSAKYCPQYDILYLEPYWTRKSRGFIDMTNEDSMYLGERDGSPFCPFSKDELRTIRDLARDGKEFVDKLEDGKIHRIQVVQTFAVCEDMCNDFALKVDKKYVGGRRGEGTKQVICDFEWESLIPEVNEESEL